MGAIVLLLRSAADLSATTPKLRLTRLNATVACTVAVSAILAFAPHRADAAPRKNYGYATDGWSLFGYSNYDYAPRYYTKPKPRAVKRPKKEDDAAAAEKIAPYKSDGSPLFLLISLKRQRVTVYDINGRIAEAPISSGRIGFPTPTGVFTVLEKNKVHFSNLYESAPMPNMQRITWSGVALHAGDLPGYPASHGCIRLPRNFSQQLFGMTKLGTRVIVSREPLEPEPITSSKLFASFPPDPAPAAAASPSASVQTVSAESTNPSAITQSLGISAADAATTLSAAQPQSPRRAKRLAEKAAAEAAVAAARDEKAKLEEVAKTAVAEADAARLGIRAANIEVGKLQAAVRKAEASRDEGDRKLADYARKFSGKDAPVLTDDQRAAAAEEERALEANALALSDALEIARAAVAGATGAVAGAQTTAAEIDQKRRDAIRALSDANVKLKTAGVTLGNIRAAEALRNYPISVFVSRKNGRLYVRQKQRPMFDAPVTFANPDQPLGTHVYTALEYANDAKTELRWNALSIPPSTAKPDTRSRLEKLKAKVQPQAVPAPVEAVRYTAQAALERLTIDDNLREQIVDVMKPGSSLIISDHGLGNETGEYTDFIVQTNN